MIFFFFLISDLESKMIRVWWPIAYGVCGETCSYERVEIVRKKNGIGENFLPALKLLQFL